MLKWLAIFAGVVGLVVAVVLMTCKYQRAREDQERNPAELSLPAAVSPSEDSDGAKQNRKCTPQTPCWYILLAWPQGITVWAVILTFAVIGWQADETRKAAEAARDGIRLQEAEMRPWVIAHMEQSKRSCLLDSGNVRFTWMVKNVGKSPAKLIEAGAMVSLDTMGPPTDQINYKMESLDERILVPGDSAPIFVFWSIVENGCIRTRLGKTLDEFNDLAIVYGRIRYRSAINTPDIYETRFSESSSISGGICDGFEPSWPVVPEDIRCT
jgi:hypothetical protein